jgi:alkyl hydroperoxide reductase subunit F
MLDANIKSQLKTYLEWLTRPIELVASLDDSAKSKEIRALLEDIESLSNDVSVRFDGTEARRPSFGVAQPGQAPRIHFAGIPMGHEFTSLILALLQTGGHPPKLSEETIEGIKALQGSHRFETFVSLSCHNCPDVVQALNTMAVLNPGIESTMIDGGMFQKEVEERQIMGVPIVYMDGEVFAQGRMTAEEILAKLDTGSVARKAEQLSQKAVFDVLVVGGGPAGCAAAIYAARKGLRTGIVAERFGGQILDTLSIENFISVLETEGPQLAAALDAHVRHYGIDVMDLQCAVGLVPGEGERPAELKLASGASLKARAVVLAAGAKWREMKVPGENEYRTKGVAFCPHCDGPLFKDKKVAVVGGGNSGVEAAIDLAGIVEHVTLLEYGDSLRADAVLQRKLASLPNAEILTRAATTAVLGDGQKVTGLAYQDRASGQAHGLDVAGVFVQIGLVPSTEWLKGVLELSASGEIVVDSRGATSAPGIFAAGDCTTVPYKQIIIAMGEGAKASLSAFDHLMRTSAPA